MIGRWVESVVCAARKRTVKKAVRNLHRCMCELSEPGPDVDTICIRMRRHIADIEFQAGGEGYRLPGVQI
jgi:hypothetical protein